MATDGYGLIMCCVLFSVLLFIVCCCFVCGMFRFWCCCVDVFVLSVLHSFVVVVVCFIVVVCVVLLFFVCFSFVWRGISGCCSFIWCPDCQISFFTLSNAISQNDRVGLFLTVWPFWPPVSAVKILKTILFILVLVLIRLRVDIGFHPLLRHFLKPT